MGATQGTRYEATGARFTLERHNQPTNLTVACRYAAAAQRARRPRLAWP